MKQIRFLIILLTCAPLLLDAQAVQNSSIPKDVQVDVTITDFKSIPVAHEIMVFKSVNYNKEYQGLTNDSGKFSIKLPVGDKYQYFVLGAIDSTRNADAIIDVPTPPGNAYYHHPFVITYKLQAPKNFVLEGCNFDNNKFTFQESAYPVLDQLFAYLESDADKRIEIEGHTDNVGSVASNLKLSLDRANAVRDYLITKGIDSSRIETKGYGSAQPIESNKTEVGRSQNRRIEVNVLD